MKRIISGLLAAIMMLSVLLPAGMVLFADEEAEQSNVLQANASFKEPSHVINIVYDDSGSMVNSDKNDSHEGFTPQWSQAKYSLEAFVAMMNKDDVINVFCLSGNNYTFKGSDKRDEVKDIHEDFKTGDSCIQTPVKAVDDAYKALMDSKNSSFDQKWLIIITDGAFTDNNQEISIDARLNDYGSSLGGNLIYLPVGADAKQYDESANFINKPAAAGEQLLGVIQEVAKIVYGRTQKEVAAGESTIPLSVSMSKVIIFIQDKDVEIKSVNNGKITDNIEVKYTEPADAVKYESSGSTFKGREGEIKTDTSLHGCVVTVEPSNGNYIPKGQLQIDFGESKPSSSYLVYYEPAVKLFYKLTKDDVTYISSENAANVGGSLNPDTYTFTAYLADAGAQPNEKGEYEPVNDEKDIQTTQLDVQFSGDAVGGEKSFSINELRNGVPLDLSKGTIDCKADASILDGKYIIDTTALQDAFKSIIVKRTLNLEISYVLPTAKMLDYKFGKTNFLLHSLNKNDDPSSKIKVVVTCYDENHQKYPITEEQWANVDPIQDIKLVTGEKDRVSINNIDKSTMKVEDGSGVFYIDPDYYIKEGKSKKGKTTHANYLHGKRTCSITTNVTMDVSDELAFSTIGVKEADRTTTYRIALCVIHTIVALFLFFWFLGYILKHKLPKQKKGDFHCVAVRKRQYNALRGEYTWTNDRADADSSRWIKVDTWTKVLPYIGQRGTIRFETAGIPDFRIKATSNRNKVAVQNKAEEFASLSKKTKPDSKTVYLKYNGEVVTDAFVENAHSSKSGFIINIPSTEFECGFGQGARFKRYSLTFGKRK